MAIVDKIITPRDINATICTDSYSGIITVETVGLALRRVQTHACLDI